ncbi:MAG: SRPBCC domain-containing protein [Burkholderiales bacterium]|nr:SRPBCC domain-containing protein [Burkholderiales bacterium]
MHRREAQFTVSAAPEALWRFIRDFESLCTCIPGVERIRRVDDRTAELTVKEKIGVVPLVVDLTARIEAEEPPRRLRATARAEHLTMEIDVALEGTAAGTELVTLFSVAGEGPLKPVVDRLFERRATERAAYFADCLGRRFGAVPAAGAPAQPPALAAPTPGLAARVAAWLGRLWRRLSG